MSGVHQRRMTVVGLVSSWVVRHPLRFQALGAAVLTLLAVTAVGQAPWRIVTQVLGLLFALGFGATVGLIRYRAGRRHATLSAK